MTARLIIIGALTLAPTVWPIAARAQQGHEPPGTPAVKPAAHTVNAHPSTTVTPATPPAAPKQRSAHGDLKSTLQRIDLQIKETLRTSHSSRRAAAPPPSPARARIRLRWRIGLTWPAELTALDTLSLENRISLSRR